MDIKNKKIMICDDDQGILDVLEMILEPEGYTVYKEIDSTLLLKRLKSEQPDLLLLDLWMPVLSGYDIIKQIRADRKIQSLPIIVLSASRNEEKIALETGCDKFISKPFDMNELIASVGKITEI
ncbi:PleD family two-component system response regulator [Chryseobacterium sp. 2TAF14]|uniref:response regulator n=1 Tax=Chryseobacterium sp. 2TAF14 TaxID=3233007 RepID=UPI003F8F9B66